MTGFYRQFLHFVLDRELSPFELRYIERVDGRMKQGLINLSLDLAMLALQLCNVGLKRHGGLLPGSSNRLRGDFRTFRSPQMTADEQFATENVACRTMFFNILRPVDMWYATALRRFYAAPIDRNRIRMTDQENADIRLQFARLKQEHADFDAAIDAMIKTGCDRLQIQRMKKKKLAIKDRMSDLEDGIIPDIIA